MQTNRDINFSNLLNQLLSDDPGKETRDDLHYYIENSFNDQKLNSMMHEHWLGLQNADIAEDEIQLLNLKNRINSKIIEKAINQKNEKWLFSDLRNVFIRVAAVLFIPLLVGSLILLGVKNNGTAVTTTVAQLVTANPGSRVHFYLPDSTEVWLNSESRLEYPSAFLNSKHRIVKLSGEGYFKVAHDAKHPFIVETQGIGIKALGTEFNVSGYPDESKIVSTLEEGSIVILGYNGKEVARLEPGEKAVLDKTDNSIDVSKVETELVTSWKDGKLIFRNTSLTDVTRQLERWFNCEIKVDQRLLESDLFYTATIQDETLGEVLKMIEISTSVKTKIERREVFIYIEK